MFYYSENIDKELFDYAVGTVFSEPPVDNVYTELDTDGAIVFAMANPTPEIMPDLAKNAGARVVGTGRSDFPNQINNVLVFPGIFRGALDCGAKAITEDMKLAAAYALANHIPESELNEENIIPSALDRSVASEIAEAVKKSAIKSGNVR